MRESQWESTQEREREWAREREHYSYARDSERQIEEVEGELRRENKSLINSGWMGGMLLLSLLRLQATCRCTMVWVEWTTWLLLLLTGNQTSATTPHPGAHSLTDCVTQQLNRDVTWTVVETAMVWGKQDFLCDYFFCPPSPVSVMISYRCLFRTFFKSNIINKHILKYTPISLCWVSGECHVLTVSPSFLSSTHFQHFCFNVCLWIPFPFMTPHPFLPNVSQPFLTASF